MFDKPNRIAWDTETFAMTMDMDGRITDGVLATELVCVTMAAETRPPALDDFVVAHEETTAEGWVALLTRAQAVEAWLLCMMDPNNYMVGQNVAFDMAVMVRAVGEELGIDLMTNPKLNVWAMYDPDDQSCATIRCTKVREKLISIAQDTTEYRMHPLEDRRCKFAYKKGLGFFSLGGLVMRYFGVDISSTKKGPDVWRLRYGELANTPLEDWPREAIEYAKDDAIWTLKVAVAQSAALEVDGHTVVDDMGRITDETPQTAADWALHLMAIKGVRTDPERSEALIKSTYDGIKAAAAKAVQAGILRPNPKNKTGYSDVRSKLIARIEAAYSRQGMTAPQTEKGNTKYGGDVLLASGDPILVEWGEAQEHMTLAKNFLGALPYGYDYPLISSPNVLVNTGRTSWRGPNLQNPPRKGGYRECFIPEAGNVFVTCDWSVAELCALAQVQLDWFGESRLADVINAGKDVHYVMAAEILGVTYDEVLTHPKGKATRQFAKVPGFGLIGGLGLDSFIDYAKNSGVIITRERAAEIIDVWKKTWPESVRYLQHIGFKTDATGEFTAVQLRSGRVRGACRYTSGANTHFQGLVSDIGKASLWQVQKECWGDPTSPLYGSRPWLFLHDEILMECAEDKADAAARRLQAIMEETAMRYHADVKAKAEPALMRRWYKGAEACYDSEGKLIPWEPTN